MKYVILIYSCGPRRTSCPATLAELTESGELVANVPLADPVNTRTILTRGMVNGPLRPGHDQLTGYLVIDCDGLDRATAIAAGLPDAHCHAVELRPVMELSGMEM